MMSEIATLLRQAAQRHEQGEGSLVKQAAVSRMTTRGMDEAVAVSLLDNLGLFATDNQGSVSEILHKTASYVEKLERELDSVRLEKQAETVPDNLRSLFNEDELKSIQTLPSAVLEKVASAAMRPESMGSATGATTPSVDPITAFIFS